MSKKKSKNRWVIGTHSAREAVAARSEWVKEICLLEGKEQDHSSLQELAKQHGLKVTTRNRGFFQGLADGHQGVAVAMTDRPRWDDSVANKEKSLVVFLDGITDPHNLGAILRTAWLLEVSGVFIPKHRAVDLTPVVCKVASGGVEHVPVESCHFASQLEWFKEQGYWTFGLSEKGTQSLPQLKATDKTVLVVGAEGKGLRSSTEKACDQLISIPQSHTGSSYNASVAFALSAYELSRSKFL